MIFYVAYDLRNKELPHVCGTGKEVAAYFGMSYHSFLCGVSRRGRVRKYFKIVKFQ